MQSADYYYHDVLVPSLSSFSSSLDGDDDGGDGGDDGRGMLITKSKAVKKKSVVGVGVGVGVGTSASVGGKTAKDSKLTKLKSNNADGGCNTEAPTPMNTTGPTSEVGGKGGKKMTTKSGK